MLLMLIQLGLNVGELCSLRVSSIRCDDRNSMLILRAHKGIERIVVLSNEISQAIENYLRLDVLRRRRMRSDGPEAFLFQPHSNYRTLEFNRALTSRWVEKLVGKWAGYAALGRVTPRDLRRASGADSIREQLQM